MSSGKDVPEASPICVSVTFYNMIVSDAGLYMLMICGTLLESFLKKVHIYPTLILGHGSEPIVETSVLEDTKH